MWPLSNGGAQTTAPPHHSPSTRPFSASHTDYSSSDSDLTDVEYITQLLGSHHDALSALAIPRYPDGTPIPEATLRRMEGYDPSKTLNRLYIEEILGVAKDLTQIQAEQQKNIPTGPTSPILSPHLRGVFDKLRATPNITDISQYIGHLSHTDQLEVRHHYTVWKDAMDSAQNLVENRSKVLQQYALQQMIPGDIDDPLNWAQLPTWEAANDFPDSNYSRFLIQNGLKNDLSHVNNISNPLAAVQNARSRDLVQELLSNPKKYDTNGGNAQNLSQINHTSTRVTGFAQLQEYEQDLIDINERIFNLRSQLYFADHNETKSPIIGDIIPVDNVNIGTGQMYIMSDINNSSDIDLLHDQGDIKSIKTIEKSSNDIDLGINYIKSLYQHNATQSNTSKIFNISQSDDKTRNRYPKLLPSQQHQLLIALSQLSLQKHSILSQRNQLKNVLIELEMGEGSESDDIYTDDSDYNDDNVFNITEKFISTPFTRDEIEKKLTKSPLFTLFDEYSKVNGQTNDKNSSKSPEISDSSKVAGLPTNFDELSPDEQRSIKSEIVSALKADYGDELTDYSLQKLDLYVKSSDGFNQQKNQTKSNLKQDNDESYSYWSYLNPWSYGSSTPTSNNDSNYNENETDYGDDHTYSDTDTDHEYDLSSDTTSIGSTASSSSRSRRGFKQSRESVLKHAKLSSALTNYNTALYNKDFLSVDIANLSLKDQQSLKTRDLLEDFVLLFFNHPAMNSAQWDYKKLNDFITMYNIQEDAKWNIYSQLVDLSFRYNVILTDNQKNKGNENNNDNDKMAQDDLYEFQKNQEVQRLWESLSPEMKLYKKELDLEFLTVIEQYGIVNNLFKSYQIPQNLQKTSAPSSQIKNNEENNNVVATQLLQTLLTATPSPKDFVEMTYFTPYSPTDVLSLPNKLTLTKSYLMHLFNDSRVSNDFRLLIDIDLTDPTRPKYIFLDERAVMYNLIKTHSNTIQNNPQNKQEMHDKQQQMIMLGEKNNFNNPFLVNLPNFIEKQAQLVGGLSNPVIKSIYDNDNSDDSHKIYVSTTSSLFYDPNYLNIKNNYSEKSWFSSIFAKRNTFLQQNSAKTQLSSSSNPKSLETLQNQQNNIENQQQNDQFIANILKMKENELNSLQQELNLPLTPLPQSIIDRTLQQHTTTHNRADLRELLELSQNDHTHLNISPTDRLEAQLHKLWEDDEREINTLLLTQQRRGFYSDTDKQLDELSNVGEIIDENSSYFSTLKHVFEPFLWLDHLNNVNTPHSQISSYAKSYKTDKDSLQLFEFLRHSLTQDLYTLTTPPEAHLSPESSILFDSQYHPHLVELPFTSPLSFTHGDILPKTHVYRKSSHIKQLLSSLDKNNNIMKNNEKLSPQHADLPSPLSFNDNTNDNSRPKAIKTLENLLALTEHQQINTDMTDHVGEVLGQNPPVIGPIMSLFSKVLDWRTKIKQIHLSSPSLVSLTDLAGLSSDKHTESLKSPAITVDINNLALYDENLILSAPEVIEKIVESAENLSNFDLKALLQLSPEEIMTSSPEKPLFTQIFSSPSLLSKKRDKMAKFLQYTPPTITPPLLDSPAQPNPKDFRAVLLFESLDPPQRALFGQPTWHAMTPFAGLDHPHETHKGTSRRHPFNRAFVVSGDTNNDIFNYTSIFAHKSDENDDNNNNNIDKQKNQNSHILELSREKERIFKLWCRKYPEQAFNRQVIDIIRDHAYISSHPAVQLYLQRRFAVHFLSKLHPDESVSKDLFKQQYNFKLDNEGYNLSRQELFDLGLIPKLENSPYDNDKDEDLSTFFPQDILSHPLTKIYLKHQCEVQKSRWLAARESYASRLAQDRDELSLQSLQRAKERIGLDEKTTENIENFSKKPTLLGSLVSNVKNALGISTSDLDISPQWPFIFGVPQTLDDQIHATITPLNTDIIHRDTLDMMLSIGEKVFSIPGETLQFKDPLLQPPFKIIEKTDQTSSSPNNSSPQASLNNPTVQFTPEDLYTMFIEGNLEYIPRLYKIKSAPLEKLSYLDKLSFYDSSFYLFGHTPYQSDEELEYKALQHEEAYRLRHNAEEHGLSVLQYQAYLDAMQKYSQPVFNQHFLHKRTELEAELLEVERKREHNLALRKKRIALQRQKRDDVRLEHTNPKKYREVMRQRALEQSNIEDEEELSLLERREDEWFDEQDIYYAKNHQRLHDELGSLPLLGADGTNVTMITELLKHNIAMRDIDPYQSPENFHTHSDEDIFGGENSIHERVVRPLIESLHTGDLALHPIGISQRIISTPYIDPLTGEEKLQYFEQRQTVQGETIWKELKFDLATGEIINDRIEDDVGLEIPSFTDIFKKTPSSVGKSQQTEYFWMERYDPHGNVKDRELVELDPRTWSNVYELLDPSHTQIKNTDSNTVGLNSSETELVYPTSPDQKTMRYFNEEHEQQHKERQRRLRRSLPLPYEVEFHMNNPALGDLFEQEFGEEYRTHLWKEQHLALVQQGIAEEDELPNPAYNHLFTGHYRDYIIHPTDNEEIAEEKLKRRRLLVRDLPAAPPRVMTVVDLLNTPRPLANGVELQIEVDPYALSEQLREEQIKKQTRLEMYKAKKQIEKEDEYYSQFRSLSPGELSHSERSDVSNTLRSGGTDAQHGKGIESEDLILMEQDMIMSEIQEWMKKYPQVARDMETNPERYYQRVGMLMEHFGINGEDIRNGKLRALPALQNLNQVLQINDMSNGPHGKNNHVTDSSMKMYHTLSSDDNAKYATALLFNNDGFDLSSKLQRDQLQLLYHTLFDSTTTMAPETIQKSGKKQAERPQQQMDQQAQHTIERNKALLSFGMDPKDFKQRFVQHQLTQNPNSSIEKLAQNTPTSRDIYNIVFDLSDVNLFDIQSRLHKQHSYKLYQDRVQGSSQDSFVTPNSLQTDIMSTTLDGKLQQQLKHLQFIPKPQYSHDKTFYFKSQQHGFNDDQLFESGGLNTNILQKFLHDTEQSSGYNHLDLRPGGRNEIQSLKLTKTTQSIDPVKQEFTKHDPFKEYMRPPSFE